MLFYDVQGLYQKIQLGIKLDKTIRGFDRGKEAGGSRHPFAK